jgi:hypothetical protein
MKSNFSFFDETELYEDLAVLARDLTEEVEKAAARDEREREISCQRARHPMPDACWRCLLGKN